MGNKKRAQESDLVIGPPSDIPRRDLIDTHAHLVSTFEEYRRKFRDSEVQTVQAFASKLFALVLATSLAAERPRFEA
jgi:hypothetical protein